MVAHSPKLDPPMPEEALIWNVDRESAKNMNGHEMILRVSHRSSKGQISCPQLMTLPSRACLSLQWRGGGMNLRRSC